MVGASVASADELGALPCAHETPPAGAACRRSFCASSLAVNLCLDEPDAGNPHVRICGGGAMEALWQGLHGHAGGNSRYMPRPSLPRERPPLPGSGSNGGGFLSFRTEACY